VATWAQVATDQSTLRRVEELTREAVYRHLKHELPYTLFQRNVQTTLLDDGTLQVTQMLIVRSRSQKAIVIGTGGRMVKQLEAEAGQALSASLGYPVDLSLIVSTASPKEVIARGLN